MVKNGARSYGGTLLVIVALLALWQFGVPESMGRALPRPTLIATTVVRIWPVLWLNLQTTALEAALGLFWGTVAAMLIAVGFVYSRSVARTVYPFAVLLRSLPLLALMPFLVSWFGVGAGSKVVLVALASFFPTLVNMVQGLTSVDRQALELMQTLNASEAQVFWKLRLPSALPHLFTSLRITSSAAVLGAIIAEWLFVNRGLGAFIVNAMFNAQGDQLWAAMVVATGLSIGAYVLSVAAERFAVPWRESQRESEVSK